MSEIISGVLGALIGSIGTYFTLRYNYNKLFAETVSNSRNLWLNEMRENISIMLAEACKAGDGPKSKKYYLAKNQVLLRMNNSEPLHLLLTNEIEKLDDCGEEMFKEYKSNILRISEKLLKHEWECVKKEAKGKGR